MLPLLRYFPSLAVLSIAVICADVSAQSGTFLTEEEFLQNAFGQVDYQQGVLWLNGDLKDTAKKILGHDYNQLRIRYKHDQHRSAWILEEIGKDRPITFGVVISNNQIVDLSVLVFRESRGGEIRHNFFTDQFHGLTLHQNNDALVLDGNVDGITGATLSVRAAKKVATLALFFHQQAFEAALAHHQ